MKRWGFSRSAIFLEVYKVVSKISNTLVICVGQGPDGGQREGDERDRKIAEGCIRSSLFSM